MGARVSRLYMKANVNLAMSTDLRTLLDREPETHAHCRRTEDQRKGLWAFLEKRPPRFTGR